MVKYYCLFIWKDHYEQLFIYTFCEVVHDTASVETKWSKIIYAVRRLLWYSYGLKTLAQLCSISYFWTPVTSFNNEASIKKKSLIDAKT